MSNRMSKLLSYLLVAGGAVLLFLGARDFLGSRVGQSDAAREFQERTSTPNPSTPQQPQQHRNLSVPNGDTLAKLMIPRLDTELYVVEGDGPRELRRGPGHIKGSAMPGDDGNCIIAGHRDTHFRVLKDLRAGDDIVLQTPNGQFLYRVKATSVISPKDTEPLRNTTDAELNLITCYPFYYVGSAPKRFVVKAELAGSVARAS